MSEATCIRTDTKHTEVIGDVFQRIELRCNAIKNKKELTGARRKDDVKAIFECVYTICLHYNQLI